VDLERRAVTWDETSWIARAGTGGTASVQCDIREKRDSPEEGGVV
jgi:hypothetical protein